MTANSELYDPNFVRRLFDEMARTYGVVNLVASFGFARHWRRQCVREVQIAPGSTVLDLMTGMGELCPDVRRQLGAEGKIIALDISPVMCRRAAQQLPLQKPGRFTVIEADALENPLADESVDFVFSTFGLKTFNRQQLRQLAAEVKRVLRPGGQFAFLEISVPQWWPLRIPYLAYLNYVIPFIGRLALGNPENYRLLGVYTSAFGDCRSARDSFAAADLETSFRSYFFGCATGLTGRKSGLAPLS